MTFLGLAALATVALAPGAVNGSASVGGSGSDSRRGLVVDAQASTSSLGRITVRFEKGAEVHLKRRAKAYDFARYSLGQTRDDKSFGGRLQVPAGKAAGRFRLRFRPLRNGYTAPARVTALLRTGRTPSLVITGLPDEAAAFQLSTVGAGTAGTRASMCRRHLVRYTGTMRITSRTGDRARGDASGRFTCRDLPPKRCTC